FRVGNAEAQPIDLNAPHMFYSRPKGEYEGEDTKRIMLDFYLVNTELSNKGNKVRATINGQEFIIDKWQPYGVEGLPMGENTFKLELLDANNNLIQGPYNSVTRTITLKGGAEQAGHEGHEHP
ncbi:MAG: phosphopeptide-binding protein, partial [Bacteroidota bacterium]|nr:phosphopeptide-binding protein [Bacteroidota bacterium]